MNAIGSVQSSWVDPQGGQWGADPLEKTQVAICFLRNTSTDPPHEAIGPFVANFFSREVHTALCEIY